MSVYRTTCKDCGGEIRFGSNRRRQRLAEGLSTDERCLECQRRAAREGVEVGLRYFDLPGLRVTGVASGSRLGRLSHPDRVRWTTEPAEDPRVLLAEGCGLTTGDIDEVFREARSHRVLVIIAPTGMGKSTLLPYLLVNPPDHPVFTGQRDQFTRVGQVFVSQPRRVAAEGIGRHVAGVHAGDETAFGAGHDFGFAIGGYKQYAEDALVVQMTDGVLLNTIVAGRAGDASVIVVDEAHERSPTIDLILGLLQRELVLNRHLVVMIVSATIDAEQFTRFFGADATIIDWSDRTKPVAYELQWSKDAASDVEAKRVVAGGELERLLERSAAVAEQVVLKVREYGSGHALHGDVLVFAPTRATVEAMVTKLQSRLRAHGIGYPVLPLYRELDEQGQAAAQALLPSPKIVVATTIAETSVTFPNLRHVVDNALVLMPRWSPTTSDVSYAVEYHSRAGCRQRWGRVGRNASGVAWTTYQESEFAHLDPFTIPSLLTQDLMTPLLQLASNGLAATDLAALRDVFLAASDDDAAAYLDDAFRRTFARAQAQELLDDKGRLTSLGAETLGAQGNRDRARLLAAADRHGCLPEAACFLATLVKGLRTPDGRPKWELPIEHFDADTRRELRARRASLFEGCDDDLDDAVRVLAGWQRLDVAGRTRLARVCWLDQRWLASVLEDMGSLLARALVNTKEERRLDPAFVPRLRAVLPHAWPERVWVRADPPEDESKASGVYRNGDDVAVMRQRGAAAIVALDLRRRNQEVSIVRAVDVVHPGVADAFGLFQLAPVEPSTRSAFAPFVWPVGLCGTLDLAQGADVGVCTFLPPEAPAHSRWGDLGAVDRAERSRAVLASPPCEDVAAVEHADADVLDDSAQPWANDVIDVEEGEGAVSDDASMGVVDGDIAVQVSGETEPGWLVTVERHDNGRPVVRAARPSASRQLRERGCAVGDVVEGEVVEVTGDHVVVRVGDDLFALDATQLNALDCPAALRVALHRKLRLHVVAIEPPGERVVLSRVPELEEPYYQRRGVGRAEAKGAGEHSEGRAVTVGRTQSGDLLFGDLAAAGSPRKRFEVDLKPASATAWVDEIPDQAWEALMEAGIAIRPGQPVELVADVALRSEEVVAIHRSLAADASPRARALAAAVDTLYRRSLVPRAEPLPPAEPPVTTPAPPPVPAGPETGVVTAVYRGKSFAGPGFWVRLPNGTSGFLPLPDVPVHLRETISKGDHARVERAGTVDQAGGAATRLRYAGANAPPAREPAEGDVFDDAVFQREAPGLVVLRFAGKRFRGAVPADAFRQVQRRRPDARSFHVRVVRCTEKGYRLQLLD